jgi:hypothetical protein
MLMYGVSEAVVSLIAQALMHARPHAGEDLLLHEVP